MTAHLLMMDLQQFHAAAPLAAPAIALQHLPLKLPVEIRVQSQARLL
jgi:hypothetical protein